MQLVSLGQMFEVTAGLAPPLSDMDIDALDVADEVKELMRVSTIGGPIDDLTRQFPVVSRDRLDAVEDEANRYAADLRRAGWNWVRVDWVQF